MLSRMEVQPGSRVAPGASDFSANVLLELTDQLLLLGNGLLDQVTDGDQAHQLAVFQHRQVAQVTIGDQRQTLLHAHLRIYRNGRATHDLPHQGTDRGATLQYALAGIVTLADHTYHLAI